MSVIHLYRRWRACYFPEKQVAEGSNNMDLPVKSEEIVARKWDKCVTDTLVKIGGGLAVGAVFSIVLFKRKSWPIVFGLGAGTGMGYANCQNSFSQPYLVHASRCKVKASQVPANAPATPEVESPASSSTEQA